ncbi:murein hydrolase activator EnvC family protein [Nonlabens marinus]|uniref:Periplasmic septal ring factor with murein hydrolase activity EnvC/YibP n=1 Tax=Nonlabens marinus S1-08 TaxID=1454201 RepID=W8VUP0_9FLAO|nr:peptidoglycan DD-metalloendopeptidase family protein [Nonlabens marinus]BAO54748.1 periplasmic septal ring factor with murein hydrolase activity EnvC/YibP [Nonlabens marinus S1-08]
MKSLLYISLFFLAGIFSAQAQSERAKLEQRRAAIQAEINQYDKLLSSAKKDKRSVLSQVQTIDSKISKTQEIINITNKQANLITRSINTNAEEIKKLNAEIKELKKEYGEMIVKAYKSKNDQSRLMFLLSSEDFLQAYKRVQYLQAYADYRKKQADEITVKSNLLEEKNAQLELEKIQKKEILAANEKQRAALKDDKAEQVVLLEDVKKNEKQYAAEIQQKARERAKIDREIRKIIEADIAASNKGKVGATKGKFFLTPEAKELARNFTNNRGKLPWPVPEGVITRRYGNQPHPVLPGIEIPSNGLRIQAPNGTSARAVFDGEVVQIVKSRDGILAVHVRHGNYTTVYGNLRSVNVQKGQKVNTLTTLGEIFTDYAGVTELQFAILEEASTQDPARWILRN